MRTSKDQHNVGSPAKPRGQQTGFAGNPDQGREIMKETPSIRGRRGKYNKMFHDESEQHIGGDAVTQTTNSPSTPAMNVPPKGESGGEAAFKKRLAEKRKRS